MTRVNLPPGCMGFKAQDGTRYMAKPGTFVDVADHHMAALKNNDYAVAGLVDAGAEKHFIKGGPQGRWCPWCPNNTIWHSWTKKCPACGMETVPESEMSRVKLEGQYRP
jgi:Zn finger protein HypA/HybF involved in hydrogenase expression